MPISQISQSNTFAQWLTATTLLIDKTNNFEDTALAVNTANAYVQSLANSVEVANSNVVSINTYLSLAITDLSDTVDALDAQAATALDIANEAQANAIIALALVNQVEVDNVYDHANAAFDKANAANVLAQTANTKAYATTQTYDVVTANTVIIQQQLKDKSNRVLVIKDESGTIIWGN